MKTDQPFRWTRTVLIAYQRPMKVTNMAYPKEVQNVTVSEGTQFLRQGGSVQVRTVQYFVGAHGPFYYTQPVTEFSAETVTRSMEQTVKQLRDIGALPAGG